MNELIPTFPRQVAFPDRRTCKTKREFYKLLNKVNGIKRKIYFSLYSCNTNGEFENPIIDKLGFDIDGEIKNVINTTLTIHNYCRKNNYRHCILFSTGGCWIFMKTKNYEKIKYPKDALRQAQEYICNHNKLSFGINKTDNLDSHIFGDIKRVGRMPGTYDTQRKKYCVSITPDDLHNNLRGVGLEQSNKIIWYGEKGFDISQFDRPITTEFPEIPEGEEREIDDEFLSKFPPCIIDILQDNQSRGNYRGRWIFTIFAKEACCFSKSFTDKIANKYFGAVQRTDAIRNNYIHYKMVKVLDLVYNNDNYFFPTCEKLYMDGFCDGKCKKYNKVYK